MAESIEALIERAEERAARPVTIERLRASSGRSVRRLEIALGEANEERLLRVLEAGPRPAWLLAVRRGTGEEDRVGSDLVATVRGGREVGIQAKSSGRAALEFIEQGRRIRGSKAWRIALVVVKQGESDEALLARAIDRIGRLVFFSSHR